MATGAACGLEHLGAGRHLGRVDVEVGQRRHALGKAARQAALGRHGQQLEVARDRLQVGLGESLLGLGRGASGRAGQAVARRIERRGDRHVLQQGRSRLVAQAELGRLPAEAAQADTAGLRVEHVVREPLDAVFVGRAAHARQDVCLRHGLEQAGTEQRLCGAQRIQLRHGSVEGEARLAQFDQRAVGQLGGLGVEAGHAHAVAPILRVAACGAAVHLHCDAVARVGALLAARVRHGGAHGHGVQPLVGRRRRRAAAVVDVAREARGLVEARPLQRDARQVAVVARFVVVAGEEIGVDQAPALHEALHVLHAHVDVRLLEDEGAVVGVVVGQRSRAALPRLGRQRGVHQARLHAVPRPQAGADDVGPFARVVAQAAGVALGGHARGRREERGRHLDHVARHQRAARHALAVGEAVGAEVAMARIPVHRQAAAVVVHVGAGQAAVGRVGHRGAQRDVLVLQLAGVHPAVAGDAGAVEGAEPGHAAGQLVLLEVLVDLERGLGDAGHAAVVDDLEAPGAVLEVVGHEGEEVARPLVDGLAGGRIHRVVGAVADLVPVLAALAAVARQATHAEARHQRAVGERELQRLERVDRRGQRHQAVAVGGRLERRRGQHRQRVVAARRLERRLQQRIPVLGTARDALQAQVARVHAEVDELLDAALAVGLVAQLRPGLAIVGGLQRVFLAVGVLPLQGERADLRLRAEVELDPRRVFRLAGPARGRAAVDRQRGGHAVVLERRRRGGDRLDRDAGLARVHGRGRGRGGGSRCGRGRRRWRRGRRGRAGAGEGLDLEDGVAIVRRALDALQAQVASLAAQAGPVLDAALAVGDRLDRRPAGAVVGDLQQVLRRVGALPVDAHAVDGHRLAEVQHQELVVAEGAAPTRVLVVVDGGGGAEVAAFRAAGRRHDGRERGAGIRGGQGANPAGVVGRGRRLAVVAPAASGQDDREGARRAGEGEQTRHALQGLIHGGLRGGGNWPDGAAMRVGDCKQR